MNRELKFRVWDKVDYMSSPFTLQSLMFSEVEFGSDLPVMQYTGFKDKTGKDIYEGDILAVWSGGKLTDNEDKTDIVRIVTYDAHDAGYFVNTPFGDECKLTAGNLHQLEVIGNIYENPELINPSPLK